MARATAQQVKLSFEKRFESELLAKCEIPEVRNALDTIRRGTWKRWKAHEPLSAEVPPESPSWGFAEPFWLEIGVCRRNGIEIRIDDNGEKPPEVSIHMGIEAEQEGLAARLQYTQDLLSPGEYDLWEIKRDAPLSRVLGDVEYQWRELREDRNRLQLLERRGSCRGPSTDRLLWAIEVYRRRCHGETWREIAIALTKGPSTLRRALTDLCERTGLPKPDKGTVLPDSPDSDACSNCTKRHSLSQPCKDCPWIAYMNRHLGPPDLPDYEDDLE